MMLHCTTPFALNGGGQLAMSSLRNWRVLVTRPATQAASFSEELEQAEAIPVLLPLIQITLVEDARTHAAWSHLIDPSSLSFSASSVSPAPRAYDWIVFTSSNGVTSTWSLLDAAQRQSLAQHPALAAVGPGTADAIRATGATVACVPDTHIAESLADALGDVRDKRILWPRSAGARDALARRLRERGAHVDEIVVYRTEPAPLPADAWERVTQSDVLTFGSPSAVRHFTQHFGSRSTQPIVCIGPVTAQAAQEAGLAPVITAEQYSIPGLMDALQHMAQTTPLSHSSTRGIA